MIRPRRVAGLQQVADVALASFASCALLIDGSLVCWGANKSGELGRGVVDEGMYQEIYPQPTPVPGIPRIVAVGAGSFHFCALAAASGRVYCWGSNVAGQIGEHETCTGKTFNDAQAKHFSARCPDPVRIDLPSEAGPVVSLALGGQTSCTLHDNGALYCWGERAKDIPGEGPRRVPGVPPFVEVANGGTHLCGITQDGLVLCWGTPEVPLLFEQQKYAVECPACVEALIKIPGVIADVVPLSGKRRSPTSP